MTMGSPSPRVDEFEKCIENRKQLVLATKPYAADYPARSWWCVLSTAFLLIASVAGTLWNFCLAGRIVCSILAGLLILRFFVIYHDQQREAILSKSPSGGCLHENLWNTRPQPRQHLEKLT